MKSRREKALEGFQIGDKVVAIEDAFLGSEYKKGHKGTIIQIKGGGLVIDTLGRNFIADPLNWDLDEPEPEEMDQREEDNRLYNREIGEQLRNKS